jgi:hypothetical protein
VNFLISEKYSYLSYMSRIYGGKYSPGYAGSRGRWEKNIDVRSPFAYSSKASGWFSFARILK